VPEAFAIISEEAPHSEENPSKTSTAVKKANPIPEPKINCFG
jgi:hypothetical protein